MGDETKETLIQQGNHDPLYEEERERRHEERHAR